MLVAVHAFLLQMGGSRLLRPLRHCLDQRHPAADYLAGAFQPHCASTTAFDSTKVNVGRCHASKHLMLVHCTCAV